MNHLIIKDIIDGDIAVSTNDGEVVFNKIHDLFAKNLTVALDFKGINIMTTAFLNAAIGQLYSVEKYSDDFLNNSLKFKNVAKEDRILFSEVVKRAKEYFKNKKGFEDSANTAIYGD